MKVTDKTTYSPHALVFKITVSLKVKERAQVKLCLIKKNKNQASNVQLDFLRLHIICGKSGICLKSGRDFRLYENTQEWALGMAA